MLIKNESALLSFTVRNSRSFRDEATLSMESSRLGNPHVIRAFESTSVKPQMVLPVAGVFGANAAGKSAFIKAMSDMRFVVLHSFRDGDAGSGMSRCPFLLGENPASTSTELQVELLLEGQRWKYGFEIDDKRVLHEYAHYAPKGRRVVIFERDGDQVEFGPVLRSIGSSVKSLTRANALVLSVLGAIDEPLSGRLFKWWRANMLLTSAEDRDLRSTMVVDLLKDLHSQSRVRQMLDSADLGLTGAELVEPEPEYREPFERALRVLMDRETIDLAPLDLDWIRLVHGGKSGNIAFDFQDESEGTKVWVGLIGPLLHTLDSGGVLLMDELDLSLHPYLVRQLIDFFQNPRTNSKCAQLIFNSHDITLLEQRELRALGRDQIWFAKKQDDGSSSLYSLADFRGRRDEPFDRHYLAGRYDAVPDINIARMKRASRSSEEAA